MYLTYEQVLTEYESVLLGLLSIIPHQPYAIIIVAFSSVLSKKRLKTDGQSKKSEFFSNSDELHPRKVMNPSSQSLAVPIYLPPFPQSKIRIKFFFSHPHTLKSYGVPLSCSAQDRESEKPPRS